MENKKVQNFTQKSNEMLRQRKVGVLVGFCDISTLVGYLIPNNVYTYVSNVLYVNTFSWFGLVGLGFVTYQP